MSLFFKIIKNRKKTVYIAGVILIIILSAVVYAGRDMLAENPFETKRIFDQPSHTATASDGSLLVTDNGKTRVTFLSESENGKIVSATVVGMKSKNGFFYAEHMASDGKKIYIADVKYAEGSTKVESERILRFSSRGSFEKILFERIYCDYDYEDMPLQYGNILDLQFCGGVLTFLMKNGEKLELYSFDDSDFGISPVLTRTAGIENAPHLRSATYDAVPDRIYAVSKNGIVYAENSGNEQTEQNKQNELEIFRDYGDTGDIPWDIACDGEGNVYITNLSGHGIMQADDNTQIFSSDDIIYRLYYGGGENDILSYTDGLNIVQSGPDGQILFCESYAPYSPGYFALRISVWVSAFVSGIAVIYIALRLCIKFAKKNIFMAIAVFSVILASLIVSVNILSASVKAYAKKNEYNITQVTLSVSNFSHVTIGDDLEKINSIRDYGGLAYSRIRETLDPVCEAAAFQNEYMYFVLYKNIDGTLVAVMDYEDTVGTVYPVGDCPEEYAGILDGDCPYMFESDSDIYGSWTYAVAPVYNSSGDITGLIEMGSNSDADMLRLRSQITDVVLSTIVLILLLILVFTEIRFTAGIKNTSDGHSPGFIRPLIFLAFLSNNICTAFIPQLSGRIFVSSGFGLSPSFGAALPLSSELFFIAAAASLGGVLIDRLGMRRVMFFGILTQATGFCLTAAAVSSGSYLLMLAGLSISGGGLGFITVCGNTLGAYCEDTSERAGLFSNINVGLVSGMVVGASLGSYIAQAAGYSLAFIFAAAVMIPAIWFGFKCSPKNAVRIEKDKNNEKNNENNNKNENKNEKEKNNGVKGVHGFLLSKSVLPFLLCMMFPFLTVMYFKDFVFPLFAAENGYSEVGIGQVMLFAGALAIFASPRVSDALLKTLNPKKTNLLAGAVFSAGLLIFALIPTLNVSIIAVYIITFAGFVGLVAQGVYFSSLRSVGLYGAGKAMGVFSLFDNLFQTAGPLIFGAALVLGYKTAVFIIGTSSLALFILFALTGREE